MSKQYLNFVQKSFKYLIFLLFVSNLDASRDIDITKYLSEIEIVSKYEDRKKGLMYRRSIPNNYGMLFVWPYEGQQCMWMKNTYVPLSVAYMDIRGKIIEIYDMVPFSKDSVCSTKAAKYALEVNSGWFEEKDINIGDSIEVKKLFSNDK
tara:strand:- start:154 stop:603 length:450 start_codon:yes stop_codon:yes gene_type:complete